MKSLKKNLMFAALTNPSNSDIYTTQYAQFVDTFQQGGHTTIPPACFFYCRRLAWLLKMRFKSSDGLEGAKKL